MNIKLRLVDLYTIFMRGHKLLLKQGQGEERELINSLRSAKLFTQYKKVLAAFLENSCKSVFHLQAYEDGIRCQSCVRWSLEEDHAASAVSWLQWNF